MKTALIVIVSVLGLGVAAMLVFVYVIQNVELPDFTLITQDGDFEVRDYPPLVVAEVIREGSRQRGLSDGFGPLARYIFAKERAGGAAAGRVPRREDRDDRAGNPDIGWRRHMGGAVHHAVCLSPRGPARAR